MRVASCCMLISDHSSGSYTITRCHLHKHRNWIVHMFQHKLDQINPLVRERERKGKGWTWDTIENTSTALPSLSLPQQSHKAMADFEKRCPKNDWVPE